MRYLAFDIECCDGKHICEFGYVITDEKFNISEKSVITINPESKFTLIGRSNDRDLKLFFFFFNIARVRILRHIMKKSKGFWSIQIKLLWDMQSEMMLNFYEPYVIDMSFLL